MERVKKYAPQLREMKNAIWSFAELSYKEFKSVAVQKTMLEAHGFRLTHDLADIPTSFMAEYGSGAPIIALIGEFDALPTLSQKVSTVQEAVEVGGNGHGCGHCLIAPGAIGAALAVKDAIDAGEVTGTIRYYACPAEEGGSAKGFMARAGIFDGIDAALFWHPEPTNNVWTSSMLAVVSQNFTFHGRSAHASSSPHMGRSALDAVELMNVGVNYLREHIPTDARVHYTTTYGGGAPNVVPAEAKVAYLIRAHKRDTLNDVLERVHNCAQGAALMTGTTFDMDYHSASDSVLVNFALADVVWEKMQEVGPTQFDAEDEAFAQEMVKTYPDAYRAGVEHITEMSGKDVTGQVISRELLLLERTGRVACVMGSSDLGDLSHIVPTAQFNVASAPIGSPGHTWHNTAAFGSEMGTKGMLQAAEILTLSALELMKDQERLQAVKDEFDRATKGQTYIPLMPSEVQPHLFTQEEVYPEGLGDLSAPF